MSDRKSNFSLDDILNDIRLERERKAGIAPPEDTVDVHLSRQAEKLRLVEEPAEPEPQQEHDGSVEELVSVYLSKEEIEKSRREAENQRLKAAAPPPAPVEKAPEPPVTEEPEPADEKQAEKELGLEELFGGYGKLERKTDKQEQERLRHRRKRINDLRKFTEGMQDEALPDLEDRERKQGKIKADLYDSIEPKDGEGLFEAVDEVVVPRKKRPSIKFNLAVSPAKTARQKAKQENQSKAVISAKEQRKQFEAQRRQAGLSSLLSGSITVILLIFAVLPRFYVQGGFLEGFIGGSGRIYLGVNLAFTALAIAVSFDLIRSSIQSIVKMSPNCDTCVLVALLFATLHNAVLLLKGGFIENGGVLYNCSAAFALFLSCLTRLFSFTRILGNLKALATSPELRSVQAIENRADSNQLAHGLSIDGRPGILYSTEAQLPDKFASLSQSRKGEERLFTYAIPIIIVLGVLAGIVGAVTSKNAVGFITSFTGCLCACLPAGMTFISNFLIMRTNAKLNKSGGVILGLDGTDELEKANAVIMDSKDIVFAEVSNFHNIKAHYDMSVEDAVTYTGAVITKGRGILAQVFGDIVKQLKINLPAVEDLKYEDRLGFSAWVNSVKVLVGNSDMMIQHNVTLPARTPEDTGDGRTTLYVAVEGKLAAAFNVTYHIGKNSAKQIKRLTKNGVVLMLLTNDPGITEQFVSKRASVSVDSIKVANSKSREIMRMYRGTGPRKKNSILMYKPSPGAMLKLVNSAYRLIDADKQSAIIQLISLIVAAGLCFAVNLLGISYIISSLVIIIYQLVWGGLACLIAGRTLNNY